MTNQKLNIILMDIDGVIKNKGRLIPNIKEQVIKLLNLNFRIKFITNCSLHKINHFGKSLISNVEFEIYDPCDVVNLLIQQDTDFQLKKSAVIGTKVIKSRLCDYGLNLVNFNSKQIDNVFIFEKLNYDQNEITVLSRSIIRGAKLFSAGMDRSFWFNGQIFPCVGSITEQIRYMTNVKVSILGKPSKFIYQLAIPNRDNYNKVICVGDNVDIDIIGAKNMNCTTVLLTNRPSKANLLNIDLIAENLEEYVDKYA